VTLFTTAVSFDAARIGTPVPLFLTHMGAFQDLSLPHDIASRRRRRERSADHGHPELETVVELKK
jgi:hypothetical protein